MAALNLVEVIMEFEPIVKLVCENVDCRFNLANDANIPERKEAGLQLETNHHWATWNMQEF